MPPAFPLLLLSLSAHYGKFEKCGNIFIGNKEFPYFHYPKKAFVNVYVSLFLKSFCLFYFTINVKYTVHVSLFSVFIVFHIYTYRVGVKTIISSESDALQVPVLPINYAKLDKVTALLSLFSLT